MLLLRPRLSFWQFDVVVAENVRHYYFHLATGEKASWAGPNAMSKVDIVGSSCDMLILEFATGSLAQPGESKCIEPRGIRV